MQCDQCRSSAKPNRWYQQQCAAHQQKNDDLELKVVVLTHLLGLSEASPQQRQEDACDGHVVSWLSDACVFSTGKH